MKFISVQNHLLNVDNIEDVFYLYNPFGRKGFLEWLFYAGGGISEKQLSEYAGKKRFVWCWKITAPRRFEIATAELNEFDLKRPPQSFCYTNYGLNSEGKITLYGVDFAS